MTTTGIFPELPPEWEPTRATLHTYAHALSALARRHSTPHPKWWHASLKPFEAGLKTETMALPGGGSLQGVMDLERHQVALVVSDEKRHEFDMTAGTTSTELGERLIAIAGELGLDGGDYDRRFDSDDPRPYVPQHAGTFWTSLTEVAAVLQKHRQALDGVASPVQVWPHGFDLSFDWFGTKTAPNPEGGAELAAQLNLGFYPAGEAYFYSNPWPFDAALLETPLPHGAQWHTEGWQGSKLPYRLLVGDPDAATKLREYAAAVFAAASPTLTE